MPSKFTEKDGEAVPDDPTVSACFTHFLGTGKPCCHPCKHNPDKYSWCKGFSFECQQLCTLGEGTHIIDDECICQLCYSDINTSKTLSVVLDSPIQIEVPIFEFGPEINNQNALGWLKKTALFTSQFLKFVNPTHAKQFD